MQTKAEVVRSVKILEPALAQACRQGIHHEEIQKPKNIMQKEKIRENSP